MNKKELCETLPKINVFFVSTDDIFRERFEKAFAGKYEHLAIKTLNDVSKLDEIGIETPCIIYGLYTSKDKERFNSYINYFDGMFLSDVKNDGFSVSTAFFKMEPFGYFEERLAQYNKAIEVLNNIEKGNITIAFSEWIFGAGHCDDMHLFSLLKDGNEIGQLDLEYSGFNVHLKSVDFFQQTGIGRKNIGLQNYVSSIIRKAMFRDDMEYISSFEDTSKVQLPCYNWDITRDEVINGNKEDIEFCIL